MKDIVVRSKNGFALQIRGELFRDPSSKTLTILGDQGTELIVNWDNTFSVFSMDAADLDE